MLSRMKVLVSMKKKMIRKGDIRQADHLRFDDRLTARAHDLHRVAPR